MKHTHLFTIAAIAAAASVANAAPPDVDPAGLYAYWPMNEGTASVVACANNNAWDGTLQTGATWVDSKDNAVFGKAIEFDGTAGFVALPNGTVLKQPATSAVSFSFWFTTAEPFENTTAMTTSYRSVYNSQVSTSDVYCVYADKAAADLRIKVLTTTGAGNYKAGIPGTNIALNTWYHAAFVYNNTDLRSYLNGTLMQTIPTPNNGLLLQSVQQDSSIGRKTTQASQFWKGKISDLAVFSRALAPAEITKLAAGNLSLKALMVNAAVSDWSEF